jgi:membrane protease YdiL (CAAX protease family)
LICPNCGHRYADGFSFCTQCGHPLPSSQRTTLQDAGVRIGPERVPWRSGQVVIAMVLIALIALVIAQVIVWLSGQDNPALAAWLTSLLVGVVILIIVWAVALRPYRASLSSLGLRPPEVPTPKWVGMTVGVLLLSLGATALYALLVRLAGTDILLPPEIPVDIVFPGPGVALTFLALALWTPLTEEIFFRGFIFAGLISRWSAPGAMIISAIIFSVFHVSPGVLIPIFITGTLFAWLYRQSGSLWPSIIAHAGQNAAALLATIYGV